jgi:uncharacterized DUF497 family protein
MLTTRSADKLALQTWSFEVAATVFRDPLALSRYDVEYSQSEERWLTLGLAVTGQLVVVVHIRRTGAGGADTDHLSALRYSA